MIGLSNQTSKHKPRQTNIHPDKQIWIGSDKTRKSEYLPLRVLRVDI